MKILTLAICLLGIGYQGALAQKPVSEKSTQFHRLPSSISCSSLQLNECFNALEHQSVTVRLNDELTIRGTVNTRTSKYGTLETIGIELSEYNQSMFALTRRQTPDRKTVFTGRIFNSKYADGFLLQQKGERYELVKVETGSMLPTCDQR